MKRETLIWTVLLLIGAVALTIRAATGCMGRSYVKDRIEEVTIESGPRAGQIDKNLRVVSAQPNDPAARFHLARSIGIWTASIFTLCILSFLYKDNPAYRFTEAVVVGVSAAYWMVVGFWSTIVPNLLAKLWPAAVQAWALPGLKGEREWVFVIPLVLGILLLCRLVPRAAWISRWPLAFFIGAFAGLKLLGYLLGDFTAQIRNTIVYVADHVMHGPLSVGGMLKATLLVVGVISGLTYFFFSYEHKGVVGKVSRVGVWFLMISFGAAFGYTVMGRIALLAIRMEFLLDDWLWLIDPRNVRGALQIATGG